MLITSMIFLLIMTGLAITAIRRATLDEKVAGNLREQNLAFQAAETALRFCQNGIESDPQTITPLIVGGNAMPSQWNTLTWSTALQITRLPAGTVANVVAQPQCLAEKWDFRRVAGVAKNNTGDVYVITARGTGSTGTAVVWLQSTVRFGS